MNRFMLYSTLVYFAGMIAGALVVFAAICIFSAQI